MILRKKLLEDFLCKGMKRATFCILSDSAHSSPSLLTSLQSNSEKPQVSIYNCQKQWFTTVKLKTSLDANSQEAFKKAIEAVKSVYIKEEFEILKAGYTKKSQLTFEDVLLFYSFNPIALPKKHLDDALAAAKRIQNAKKPSNANLNAENYKLIIFCRTLIKPLDSDEVKKFVYNIKREMQNLKEQPNQLFELLVYLTATLNPPAENKYEQLYEIILSFVINELIAVDLFSDFLFQSLKHSNYEFSNDVEHLLGWFSNISLRLLELKNPKNVPNHKQFTQKFFMLIRTLASIVNKLGPFFSKSLYDTLIAAIIGKDNNEMFLWNELLIMAIQGRTAALLTMSPANFSRTFASISIFQLHRINKKTVEAFGNAVSEYLIKYGGNLNVLGWSRVIYAFGKYFPINAEGIEVLKEFLQEKYKLYEDQKGYTSLFLNVFLCGISTYIIDKRNIANYYEDFNKIAKESLVESNTNKHEISAFIKVFCSFARADLYSWKLWEHFSKFIASVSEEEFRTNFHFFYLLHHLDLFLEDIEDKETKAFAEFLTRQHPIGADLLKNKKLSFYHQFKADPPTQFAKGFASQLRIRGISVVNEYAARHLLIDHYLPDYNIGIDLLGSHHHIGQTSVFNLQTTYRTKVFKKMGIKYISVALNKDAGEIYMNPYLKIFSQISDYLETSNEVVN